MQTFLVMVKSKCRAQGQFHIVVNKIRRQTCIHFTRFPWSKILITLTGVYVWQCCPQKGTPLKHTLEQVIVNNDLWKNMSIKSTVGILPNKWFIDPRLLFELMKGSLGVGCIWWINIPPNHSLLNNVETGYFPVTIEKTC